jgi:hypothetical protein
MAASKLRKFAQVTLNVLSKQRFVDYLPTLLIGREVQVIEGIPSNIRHREAMQRFIKKNGLAEKEFLFGVRSGRNEITIGHHRSSRVSFMQIVRSSEGYSVAPMSACKWWKLES